MSTPKVSGLGKMSQCCQNNWIIAAISQQREKASTWEVSEPLNYPSHPIMSPSVLVVSILTALRRLVKGHSDVLGRVESFLPLGEGMNLRDHTAQMCSLCSRRDLLQTFNLNLVSLWDWSTPSHPFQVSHGLGKCLLWKCTTYEVGSGRVCRGRTCSQSTKDHSVNTIGNDSQSLVWYTAALTATARFMPCIFFFVLEKDNSLRVKLSKVFVLWPYA